MSYTNYQKAIELAKQCTGYWVGDTVSEQAIQRSEELLGLKFSKQNREYYSKLGYLSFFGCETYSIDPDDNSGILEGNSVAYALNERAKFKLPQAWLPIYSYDDGYLGFLDYSQLNSEGEPSVIMGVYNGEEYVMIDKVADDFGDFLMELVNDQLEDQ